MKKPLIDLDYKLVLVTRKDLDLSIGKLAVQVSHAAVNCAFITKKNHPKWFSKWQHEGAKKVVVVVDSINDFKPLQLKAKELDIDTDLITDAGHTEVPAGTVTVLGIGPAPSNLIDQVTKDLSLL